MFRPSGAQRGLRPKPRLEREERQPVTKSAYITMDGADPMVACTVRDINTSGARLSFVDITKAEDEFLIISRAENLVARARVAWRRDNEMGVRFLRSTRLDNEERMRREQAQVFARNQQARAQAQAQAAAQAEQQAAQAAQMEQQAVARLRFDRMVVLGMDPRQGYTKDVLRSAYHAAAKATHPDQGGDAARFEAVKAAYEGMLAEFPV